MIKRNSFIDDLPEVNFWLLLVLTFLIAGHFFLWVQVFDRIEMIEYKQVMIEQQITQVGKTQE